MAELSSNARKQQEDDIERLVKCRVRSQIEARKAAEATMKRAVHEARELKKELVIMRQEKEDWKAESKKTVLAAATAPAPVVTKDDLQKKLAHEKSKYKELAASLQQTQAELQTTRELSDQRATELTKTQRQLDESTQRLQDELMRRQREGDAQAEDAHKYKALADEAKRKYQRVVKDKKEEVQRLVDENAQLTKRCESLEKLVDDNAKLRRQLEKARSQQGGAADEWQRKLDQREQVFLQQEQANKRLVTEKQTAIESLAAENDQLGERIRELDAETNAAKAAFGMQLQREQTKYQDLVTTTKQLQERLVTLKEGGRAADKARLEAEARLLKEVELREAAEAAADAVESRTHKLEGQLLHAQDQLERIEKALKTKGITLEYLLHQQSSSNNTSSSKREIRPEETETATVKARAAAQPPPALLKSGTKSNLLAADADKAKPSTKLTATGVKTSLLKSKQASTANNNQSDREPTPERTRR